MAMNVTRTMVTAAKTWTTRRPLSLSWIRRGNSTESKPAETSKSTETGTSWTDPNSAMHTVRPTTLDKIALVSCGKYKSMDEVPERMSLSALSQAKSKLRIRGANYLMVFLLLLCFGAAWMGKGRYERGDTLQKQYQQYADKLREDSRKAKEGNEQQAAK